MFFRFFPPYVTKHERITKHSRYNAASLYSTTLSCSWDDLVVLVILLPGNTHDRFGYSLSMLNFLSLETSTCGIPNFVVPQCKWKSICICTKSRKCVRLKCVMVHDHVWLVIVTLCLWSCHYKYIAQRYVYDMSNFFGINFFGVWLVIFYNFGQLKS